MVILAVALLALADDSLAATSQPLAERVTRQCNQVTLTPVLSPSARATASPSRRSSDEFSASVTLDLGFRTTLTPAAAGHKVQFRLYTPRGYLYQELASQPRTDSKLGVEARLPVAGTDVVNHSLYGTWTVSAHVDGATQPCSRARAFSLTP
jgi:hypothetical protein